MIPLEVALILGGVATLVAIILLYVKVMPKKHDGNFKKAFPQKLHDFFHFKKLYLEEVLKFIYVLATVAMVCMGAFLLLAYYEDFSWMTWATEKKSTLLYGLALIVAGPIVLRLSYEVFMMFILLVKNTIEINNKLSVKKPVEAVPVAPVAPVAPAAEPVAADPCEACVTQEP